MTLSLYPYRECKPQQYNQKMQCRPLAHLTYIKPAVAMQCNVRAFGVSHQRLPGIKVGLMRLPSDIPNKSCHVQLSPDAGVLSWMIAILKKCWGLSQQTQENSLWTYSAVYIGSISWLNAFRESASRQAYSKLPIVPSWCKSWVVYVQAATYTWQAFVSCMFAVWLMNRWRKQGQFENTLLPVIDLINHRSTGQVCITAL